MPLIRSQEFSDAGISIVTSNSREVTVNADFIASHSPAEIAAEIARQAVDEIPEETIELVYTGGKLTNIGFY